MQWYTFLRVLSPLNGFERIVSLSKALSNLIGHVWRISVLYFNGEERFYTRTVSYRLFLPLNMRRFYWRLLLWYVLLGNYYYRFIVSYHFLLFPLYCSAFCTMSLTDFLKTLAISFQVFLNHCYCIRTKVLKQMSKSVFFYDNYLLML